MSEPGPSGLPSPTGPRPPEPGSGTPPPSVTPGGPTPSPPAPPTAGGPVSLGQVLADLRPRRPRSPARLNELAHVAASRPWSARDLGRELMTRDGLTPFQVNYLLQGRGRELVLGGYALL